ncbi:glycosyltransferase [Ideonella sp. 4Y16]|uniref:Glycosyltransferase n=1 Tax=Ideonella alba TaxID=2824118 RepID=A0A941BF82_9BURK|nr:glycosyltransferase [Ideonella alba]MBQ0929148.1 glycosyltransferase [Ideonella alba]MBQ0943094.1 glycosyltransferase [Ideonella alba]
MTPTPAARPAPARPWSLAFLAVGGERARTVDDGSWRYRMAHLAQALQARGHRVHLGHGLAPLPWRPDLVLLHRPADGFWLRRRLAAWRRAGVPVLADFDDLVFEPALAPESPAVLNRRLPEAEMARRYQAHRAVLAQVDGFTVATQALAEELHTVLARDGLARPVACVPNAVPPAWRGLPATPWPADPAGPAIGYFSGTHSHDRDLAEAAPGLAQALRGQPGWRLQLVGRGDFAVDVDPARLRRLPRLPFDNGYTDALRQVALALLPLQPTRFNRCKSALKLIEAGWWNVPVLASPLPDARRFAGPGLVTVERPQDWADALQALMADPARLAAASSGLRERVLAQADGQRIAADWRRFVVSALGVGR